eukprot:13082960-Heterocapsa_arctica.AAC.1
MHLIRGATDNQGNRYVVAKLMSNRCPLNVVAMELASQLERTLQWLVLVWAPREDNREADDLTNSRTSTRTCGSTRTLLASFSSSSGSS